MGVGSGTSALCGIDGGEGTGGNGIGHGAVMIHGAGGGKDFGGAVGCVEKGKRVSSNFTCRETKTHPSVSRIQRKPL